jgi:MSHA biogenesis protein MshG
MPYFHYKARNARGELLTGMLEGADSNAIAGYLLNTRITPVEIWPASKAKGGMSGSELLERLNARPVTTVDIQLFSRQMYTLLKAGVPILAALKGLEGSATNKTFAKVLGSLRGMLDSGRELSVAMREHPKVFSAYYVSMVGVGEVTGKLNEIFPRLHDYLEFERSMKEQITAALRYPKFVLMAMASAIGIINAFVVPQFAKIFSKAKFDLPAMTKVLMGTSQFTISWWPVLLTLGAAGFFGFRSWVGTKRGRYLWDKLKTRMPLGGSILMKGTMARFARSYALAYQSGLPASQTLAVVARTVDNAYVAAAINQMREGVERGEGLHRTASTTGAFAPIVLQMIGVGEETGEIASLMSEIADMYEREVQYELKTLSARIEPVLLGFMGVLVLILALGVFVPMWDMGQVQLQKTH